MDGFFRKSELQALAKCLASAWEVHACWFTTSCSRAISWDWSMTTWHVDNDCRPSWARLCCFDPINTAVKSCCRVNSTVHFTPGELTYLNTIRVLTSCVHRVTWGSRGHYVTPCIGKNIKANRKHYIWVLVVFSILSASDPLQFF